MKLDADAARSLLDRQGLIHEVTDDIQVPLKSLMSILIWHQHKIYICGCYPKSLHQYSSCQH